MRRGRNHRQPYYVQTLQALGKFYKFTLDTKWKDLPKKTKDAILFGSGDDEIKFSYEDGVRSYDTKKPFEGVVTNIERRFPTRPKANGHVRNSASISPTCLVKPVTAIA